MAPRPYRWVAAMYAYSGYGYGPYDYPGNPAYPGGGGVIPPIIIDPFQSPPPPPMVTTFFTPTPSSYNPVDASTKALCTADELAAELSTLLQTMLPCLAVGLGNRL